MIDGRGQVRITDFGLAALAAEIPLSDLRSGTPAYMSPEQKAGKEVTTRSDIYSLGLVLHEMFTGKSRKDAQTQPVGACATDLDPAIERLILRCLDEEPKRRPSSALGVAMALPGGDPDRGGAGRGRNAVARNDRGVAGKGGIQPACGDRCVSWEWFCRWSSVCGFRRRPASWRGRRCRSRRMHLPTAPNSCSRPSATPKSLDQATTQFTCCDQQAIENSIPLSRRAPRRDPGEPSSRHPIFSVPPASVDLAVPESVVLTGEPRAGRDLGATGCEGQTAATRSPAVAHDARDSPDRLGGFIRRRGS